MWFSATRDATRTLEEDIDWGDETFPVNARVKGEFGFDIYELAYEYAFLRRDSYEVSGTFGLHYTELDLTMSAKAESSGGALDRDISESGNVGAPLPAFGCAGSGRCRTIFGSTRPRNGLRSRSTSTTAA